VKDASISTIAWSKVSGSGKVIFGPPNAAQTSVRADTDGGYTIRLTAVDTAGNSSSDDVTFMWDTTPPRITHSPIRSGLLGQSLAIEMGASDASAFSGGFYYRPGGEHEFRDVSMTKNGAVLIAELPGDEISYGLSYYLEATDTAGNASQFPEGGVDEPLGIAVSGTYTDEVDFPAQAWHLFSVPLAFVKTDLKTLLDDATGLNNWATNIWNGIDSVQTLEPATVLGAPLWLISKTPFRLQVEGTTVDPSQQETVSLSPGWNLVANPYLFPVPFGNITVLVDNQPISLNDSRASNLVRTKFWRWQDATPNDVTDGDYEVVTNLSQQWEPWTGYWMFADQAATVQIGPFTDFALSAPSISATPQFDWLGTVAIGNTREVTRVQLALANDSHQDTNLLNVEQPPLPTEVSISLTKNNIRFQRLSLARQTDEWYWDAEIHASYGTEVTLFDRLPDGHHLYMENQLTGFREELIPNMHVPVLDGKHQVQFLLTKQRLGRVLEGAIPISTELLANYPNPFNPETWIPYQLATGGDIQISIYDINGMLVRSLDPGHQKAGYYVEKGEAAYWDGRSTTGERVSSGLYFYYLKTDGFSSVKRMTILK